MNQKLDNIMDEIMKNDKLNIIENNVINKQKYIYNCHICKIPYTKKYVLIPCGHSDICYDCIQLINGKCPICRTNIISHHQLYSNNMELH